MASISNDPGGRRRILFINPNGERKTIRLGKVSQRDAEAFNLRVELLLVSQFTGNAIDAETARWVASRPKTVSDKLARVGLIARRADCTAITLSEHLQNYVDKRCDVKSATVINWGHTRRCLLAYFDGSRRLESITAGDARDWERWLKTGEAREYRYDERENNEGLAPNTVRKRVSNAKQFFQDAVSRELIAKNPFAGLKGSVGSNRERDFFIRRDVAEKVLAACPDNEWRLLFALSRYGGLRCPSEHLALMWGDVNWAEGRILIRSAKTEHHEGKGTRVVPIFPELRQHLEAAWDAAEEGATYVITRYRDGNANLRTQLNRIIKRAGVKAWPKLFHNLRASRATELANEYPAHVAAAWLGHSTLVAQKHYWQVTEADFAKAIQCEQRGGAKSGEQVHVEGRGESQIDRPAQNKTPVLPGSANVCDSVQIRSMGGTGLEPVTPTV